MQTADEAQLRREATVFTQYIIGEEADEQSIELYTKSQEKLNIKLTTKETKRLGFMLKHSSIIAMIDGALALHNAESGIRKKIYTMFAILESNPKYAKYFLSKENRNPILQIIGYGIRAVFNTLIGLILLPWI
ncbi:MAG TPA: hypothetical protein VK890_09145 [Bacteroidia bacterium]|jgi:hypothetical protein|nr:hypothetical protein [Bacteroidia bacterium]